MHTRHFVLALLTSLPLLAQATGVDAESNSVTISISTEPATLDSSQTADSTSNYILGHLMDGLTRFGRRDQVVPGIAESWHVEGQTYTFRLRDTEWTDGQPVTAADFVFGWRTAVNPETASPFSSSFYVVQNAREILAGDMPVESLGVRAIDEKTLEVTLTHPVVYFPQLVAGTNFFPIREDFYQAQGELYAAEPEHLVTNGPFMLEAWTHGAQLTLVKNPDYWNAENVHLDRINIDYITPDNATVLNLFRDGKVAFAGLDDVTVKSAAEAGIKMRSYYPGSTQLLIINTSPDRPTGNVHLRRALAAALDRETIINSVLAVPGNKLTYSIYADWMPTVIDGFGPDDPLSRNLFDIDVAREEFKKARAALGEIPPLTILTLSSPNTMKLSEYMQGIYKRQFGIEFRIDGQTMKQWLAKAFSGAFDVTVISYGALVADPADPGALFASESESNLANFNNAEYDRLFRQFSTSADPLKRTGLLREMQVLLEDQVPVVALFEHSSVYVQDSRLRGVIRGRMGLTPSLVHARIR